MNLAESALLIAVQEAPALNPLEGNSLACTERSTSAPNTDGYLYADDVHPTPRGYRLIADYLAERLERAGWL